MRALIAVFEVLLHPYFSLTRVNPITGEYQYPIIVELLKRYYFLIVLLNFALGGAIFVVLVIRLKRIIKAVLLIALSLLLLLAVSYSIVIRFTINPTYGNLPGT